jgi:predicted nuclease with TOPRIM domain
MSAIEDETAEGESRVTDDAGVLQIPVEEIHPEVPPLRYRLKELIERAPEAVDILEPPPGIDTATASREELRQWIAAVMAKSVPIRDRIDYERERLDIENQVAAYMSRTRFMVLDRARYEHATMLTNATTQEQKLRDTAPNCDSLRKQRAELVEARRKLLHEHPTNKDRFQNPVPCAYMGYLRETIKKHEELVKNREHYDAVDVQKSRHLLERIKPELARMEAQLAELDAGIEAIDRQLYEA